MNIWDFFGRITGGLSDRYLGTNWLSSQAAEQDYQRTQELRKTDFNNQVTMMNMQNEYNAPANQMSRLRDAGLNPHLVNGQPVALSANPSGSTSASFSQPRGANGAGDLIQSIQNASFMKKQKELLQAEIDNKNQDTQLKSGQYNEVVANATFIKKQTDFIDEKVREINANIEVAHANRNMLNEQGKKIAYETDIVINDLAFRNETFADMVDTIKQQGRITKIQANNMSKLITTQIRQMEHYINYLDSMKDLNAEQKEYVSTLNGYYGEMKRIAAKNADIIEGMGNTEHVIQMCSQLLQSLGMFMGGASNLLGTILSKGTKPDIYINSDSPNLGDFNYNGVID